MEIKWRELFGGGPTVGCGSADDEAMGGARKRTLGVCALAGSEEALDGAEAGQEVEGGSLLALYHAREQFSFAPVLRPDWQRIVEFQSRFHAKCSELGLEHFYIHKSSPDENAVIERGSEPMRRNASSFWTNLLKTTANSTTGTSLTCKPTTPSPYGHQHAHT